MERDRTGECFPVDRHNEIRLLGKREVTKYAVFRRKSILNIFRVFYLEISNDVSSKKEMESELHNLTKPVEKRTCCDFRIT